MTKQILSLSLARQLRGAALRSRRFDRIVWVAIFLLCGSTAASQTDVEGVRFFEQKIRPVLVERCYKCHSTGAKKVQAGLLLDTRQAARAGGGRGPAVVPGNVGDSLLIEAIRHESLEMPPDGKLPDSVIADFVRWVEIGAPDPRDGAATPRAVDNDAGRKFWSFLPLRNYEPPEVPEAEWALTPIDRFILARQQASGVEPSPIADHRTLLRRAYFGLTGLPPSPDETGAFLSDVSPQAYERLVDELLRSPHYGERWARYWLDVVRFAESNGFEQDEDRPEAYHYRDFVIRALNEDMPYDQFVRWQIAGDLLAPDSQSARAATGFLVAGVENVVQTEKEFEREIPAVSVPLGDFFADASGRAANFSTSFVENSPGSYNCYIPMPFRESARVTLRNEADRDLSNYTYVEWERLPQWVEDLGYFHAFWSRRSFQLNSQTRMKIFRLDGPSHVVGQYWYVCTNEPLFAGLNYVMEANNQYRVDGEQEPALNYLGTECAFNFCWGWRELFSGHKIGINWVQHEAGDTGVSTYRFRDTDAIYFQESLELTLDWTAEFKSWPGGRDFIDRIARRNEKGCGWIDYSTTTYWYSADPAGREVGLLPVAERLEPLLRKNPPLS